MTDGRGKRIGEIPGLAGLPPNWVVDRVEFGRALREQAVAKGIRFEHGKRLLDADETSAAVTARFDDGSAAIGDVLIGADGIHSVVRKLIDPNAPDPVRVPLLNFGGVADIPAAARPDAMYFVFGDRGFFGYWLQPDGRTAWFSNLPSAALMTSAQARAVPADEWLRRLRGAYMHDEPARVLLQHTAADRLVVLGSMEMMPTLPHWHRGRMVLVGDSAHAPSSSSGQGASLAIESAIELARCLRDVPDVGDAFVAFERHRRVRVEQVAARAAKTNQSKTLGPVARTLMRLLMPVAMRTFMDPERTLGAEQRYRIEWSEVVA